MRNPQEYQYLMERYKKGWGQNVSFLSNLKEIKKKKGSQQRRNLERADESQESQRK